MASPFSTASARAMATAAGKNDSRARLIRAVRGACKRVGLDDDDRRVLQREATGKDSLGDMNLHEIGLVLDRVNRGYTAPASGQGAHQGKVRALWWSLYFLGLVDEADRGLDAFVRRQTSVSALRFLDHRQAHSVIDALKSWLAREGVEWPRGPHNEVGERSAVLRAIWAKLENLGAVSRRGMSEYVAAALSIPPREQREWTAREYDAAIRQLGKRLRRELGRERDRQ